MAWDGSDYEVFFYNGQDVLQLTDNDVDDVYAAIADGQVVWQGWDPWEVQGFEACGSRYWEMMSCGDWEIFLWGPAQPGTESEPAADTVVAPLPAAVSSSASLSLEGGKDSFPAGLVATEIDSRLDSIAARPLLPPHPLTGLGGAIHRQSSLDKGASSSESDDDLVPSAVGADLPLAVNAFLP